MDAEHDRQAIDATRRWIDVAVVGLNLCPFARPVLASERVRYRVSHAQTIDALRTDLTEELRFLAGVSAAAIETTLLIHPWVLGEFLEFNEFLGEAETVVEALGLTGELQVASFHPRYQFAGTRAADVENCTNRAPFPILHLLREASIERALATFADPATIYQRNIETMRRLGNDGWKQLQEQFGADFFR